MWRVDAELLISRLRQLSRIGATHEGCVTRTAFSPADVEARQVIAARMIEAGLRIGSDAIGNTIGRLDPSPTDPLPREVGSHDVTSPLPASDLGVPRVALSLPKGGRSVGGEGAIVLGSHTDTVPNGGKYDGALGVVAAIECARVIGEAGGIGHPLEVVNFVNEERGVMGSRAWAGQFAHDEIAASEIREAIRQLGGNADDLASARRDPKSIRAYLELHIEQGPRLEREGVSIGLVTGIVGMKRLVVEFSGEAAHAGATPMNQRRDALLAASRLVVAVNDIARRLPGEQVATVGQINAVPNASNVIAGRVELTIDLRDIAADMIAEMERSIRLEAKDIGATTGIMIEFNERDFMPPATSDDTLLSAIERAADEFGLSTMRLVSHAGHDASIIGQLAPMAMIFVPSVGGISHSPKEFTRDEDCVNGANVLLNALRLLSANQRE